MITASDRAARALRLAFHRRRRAEGLAAWPAPSILDWTSFVRAAWEERATDGRLLLNPRRSSPSGRISPAANDISPPSSKVRVTASPPWPWRRTSCSAPMRRATCAKPRAPAGIRMRVPSAAGSPPSTNLPCRQPAQPQPRPARADCASAKRLRTAPASAGCRFRSYAARPERALRRLGRVAGACGRPNPPKKPASTKRPTSRPNSTPAPCGASAACRQSARPPARHHAGHRRPPRRNRARFSQLRCTGQRAPLFEFSLGIPLSQVDLPRSRASAAALARRPACRERSGLAALHRTAQPLGPARIRRPPGLHARVAPPRPRANPMDPAGFPQCSVMRTLSSCLLHWVQRIDDGPPPSRRSRRQPPEPARLGRLSFRSCSSTLGWPGERRLSSAEFQALAPLAAGRRHLRLARLRWPSHRAGRNSSPPLTAPSTKRFSLPNRSDAPIQIAGPAESAGLTADAIWFLGADEDAWPAAGSTHPLAADPGAARSRHAPRLAAARLGTGARHHHAPARLRARGPFQLCAGQKEDVETRPSRLIVQLAGAPQPLPAELTPLRPPSPAHSSLSKT